MAVTVNDVLSLKGFEHAVVVAGKKGLANEVRKATLMEVPDIFPFLEKKSFILTTLYPIHNDPEALHSLVPKSFQADAAALCIKIGRYVDEIPPSMIKQAEELNFPLIELHGTDNLSALALEILSISLDEHISQISFLNSVHYHLMTLFLQGHDVDRLVNEFSRLIQAPVVLLDSHYQVLAVSPDTEKNFVHVHTGTVNNKGVITSITLGESTFPAEEILFHPIEAGGRIFGYILLMKAADDNGNLIRAVEEASLLLASAFYKNYAVAEKERNFKDAFARDLLQGKKGSQMDALHEARLYGWEMEFPQVLLVLKIYSANASLVRLTYEELIDKKTISRTINKKLYSSPNKIMVTFLDNALVTFVNVAFVDDAKEKMKEIGKELLKTFPSFEQAGIGISSPILEIQQFPTAYEEAQNSLKIGRKLHHDSFVSHIEDHLIYHVLKEVGNKAVLEKLVQITLGEIIQHDRQQNSQLLETLYVLILTGYNLKETASRLYIHYNTLRYRINRLKDFGFDMKQDLQVAEIIFAYHAHLWLDANKNPSNLAE